MTIGAARTPMALFIDLLASFAAVAVWVEMAGQDDGPAPSFVAVAAVVLGSWALARVLQMTDLDQDAMRLVGVGASFVALFVIGRLEYAPDEWLFDPGWIIALVKDPGDAIEPNAHVIAGMVALAPLWLRGVIRGQAPIEFDSVLTSASLGMVAVVVAALVTPETRETVSWGAYALVYAAGSARHAGAVPIAGAGGVALVVRAAVDVGGCGHRRLRRRRRDAHGGGRPGLVRVSLADRRTAACRRLGGCALRGGSDHLAGHSADPRGLLAARPALPHTAICRRRSRRILRHNRSVIRSRRRIDRGGGRRSGGRSGSARSS